MLLLDYTVILIFIIIHFKSHNLIYKLTLTRLYIECAFYEWCEAVTLATLVRVICNNV